MQRLCILIVLLCMSLGGCATYYALMDNREYGRCLDRCDETFSTVDDSSLKQACRSRCEKDREWKSSLRQDMDR